MPISGVKSTISSLGNHKQCPARLRNLAQLLVVQLLGNTFGELKPVHLSKSRNVGGQWPTDWPPLIC